MSKGHYALPNNMVNYTYHQSSYHIWKLSDQRPQRNCIHKVQLYWICMMTLKSHNSYNNHWIKMVWYNMINYTSVTNHPTKYERYWTNDLRGIAFTKWSRTHKPKNYMPPYCHCMQGQKNPNWIPDSVPQNCIWNVGCMYKFLWWTDVWTDG